MVTNVKDHYLKVFSKYFLVRSCLLITLIKCLKGHKSQGSAFEGVLKISLSLYCFSSFFSLNLLMRGYASRVVTALIKVIFPEELWGGAGVGFKKENT